MRSSEYELSFEPAAEKSLLKLEAALQKRILSACHSLQTNPKPRGSIKLQGEFDHWRIRVGDYRVVYTVIESEVVVVVLTVDHRRQVYKKLRR